MPHIRASRIVHVFDLRHWTKKFDNRINMAPYAWRHMHQNMNEGDFIVCPRQDFDALKEMLAYYRGIGFVVPLDENIILIDGVTSNNTEIPAVLLSPENEDAYRRVAQIVREDGRVEGFEATEAFDLLIERLREDTGHESVSLTPLREIALIHGDKLWSRQRATNRGLAGYLQYEMLPPEITDAHEAAEWFIEWGKRHKGFVAKDPRGASGLGNFVPPSGATHEEIIGYLIEFLNKSDWIQLREKGVHMFAEEYFGGHTPISFTFRLEHGRKPRPIGATLQIQSEEKPGAGFDVHEGNIATRSIDPLLPDTIPSDVRERIHADCMELLRPFLEDMLEIGFEGYMGSDLMLRLKQDDAGDWTHEIFIAEFNMRCTGSVPASATYAQTNGCRNDVGTVIAAMNTSFEKGDEVSLAELRRRLGELAYTRERPQGIVVCMAPGLPGKCILQAVAGSIKEAIRMLTDARYAARAKRIEVIGLEDNSQSVIV